MAENHIYNNYMEIVENTPNNFETQGAGRYTLLQETGNKDMAEAILKGEQQKKQQPEIEI